MGVETFRCNICDTIGKWKNVDEFRYKAQGMHMCETCGFVTYPEIQQKTEDLTEFYREEYREPPSVNNLFSGERKLHYHGVFLDPLLKKWEKDEVKKPHVLEIGSAFGLFLNWFKQKVPDSETYGTELTLSFRRNAWWLYGIRLEETPDWTKKYDLICSYKVAEHIPNIDKELRQYAEALTEKGCLYISVPTWFGSMCNFGLNGFSLEYYYHKNHINVWSKNLFESLLKKCGLKIVRYNGTFYDDTYLCIRDDSMMLEPRSLDSPEVRLDELRRIKEAAKNFDLGEFSEALTLWDNFPDAHINNYERQRGRVHKEGFKFINKTFIETGLKACPNSNAFTNFAADLNMRYEEFSGALKLLERSLELRPNDPQALTALGHCYRQMGVKSGDPKEKERCMKEAREVMKYLQATSKQLSFESITWQMQDNSMLPMPFEVNQAAVRNEPKLSSSR